MREALSPLASRFYSLRASIAITTIKSILNEGEEELYPLTRYFELYIDVCNCIMKRVNK